MSPEDFKPVKVGIWWIGNAAWLFGLTERSIAASTDGFVSAIDIGLIAIAAMVFAGWFLLGIEVDR